MAFILFAAGLLELVAGVLVLAAAPAITQQIAGILLVGASFVTLGLGAILREATGVLHSLKTIEGQINALDDRAEDRMKPVAEIAARFNKPAA